MLRVDPTMWLGFENKSTAFLRLGIGKMFLHFGKLFTEKILTTIPSKTYRHNCSLLTSWVNCLSRCLHTCLVLRLETQLTFRSFDV